MGKNKFSGQNIYILLSILLPVLSIYATPISGLDLGTACILVFSLFLFLFMRGLSFHLGLGLTIILTYSFLVSIPILIGIGTEYSSPSTAFFRLFRFIIILLIMIGCGYSSYYDEKKYASVLRVASIIVASYAIIQSIVFRIAGIKLRNLFGPERGGAIFSPSLGEYENVYRPPSFFLEPSGVTYFLTPLLCYILFRHKEMTTNDYLIAVVLTIGMIVSTSGQGLLVIALCWGLWVLSRILTMRITGIIVALICATLFFHYYDVSYSFSRITTNDELNAVDARTGGYDLFKSLSGNDLLFGTGFGNYDEHVYYSSFAEILFCTGVLGLLIVLSFYAILFIRGVYYQRVLVLASLLLMVGGGIYTATYLCLYLPLMLPKNKRYLVSKV